MSIWKSLKHFFLGFAAALSLQCVHSSPRAVSSFSERTSRTVYVDSNFRDEELTIIEESARAWSVSTKGIARISVVRLASKPGPIKFKNTPEDIFLEKEESTSINIVFHDYTTESILYGIYLPEPRFSRIVLVTDRFTSWEEYRSVMTHELGHALGLGHNSIAFSLMYRDHGKVGNRITRDDLAQFCEIYDCDVEELLAAKK